MEKQRKALKVKMFGLCARLLIKLMVSDLHKEMKRRTLDITRFKNWLTKRKPSENSAVRRDNQDDVRGTLIDGEHILPSLYQT